MSDFLPARRSVIAGLFAASFAPVSVFAAEAPTTFDLPVKDRVSKITVWSPEKPKAVVLFSHGAGSWPDRYDLLVKGFVAQGYAVLAPLHTESMKVAEDKRTDLKTAFGDRIADMATLAGYAQQAYPGLPLVAAGHSYGSLFSLMLGGALEYVAPVYNPAIKAAVCFSSPGAIPGLVNPAAFTSVKIPLLMITGDQDLVPGFVTDWHDHELPFKGTPVKESYLLTIKDGDHLLVSGQNAAQFAVATQVASDFVRRELFDPAHPVALPAGAKAELASKTA